MINAIMVLENNGKSTYLNKAQKKETKKGWSNALLDIND